jgi:CheY-like chemotaxis protein
MPDILLVEDKESLRRVLRMTLENAGYSVTEAPMRARQSTRSDAFLTKLS